MTIDKDFAACLELLFSPRPKGNDADGRARFKSETHSATCKAVQSPRVASCDCERGQLAPFETVKLSSEQIDAITDLVNRDARSSEAMKELREIFATAIDCNVTKLTS